MLKLGGPTSEIMGSSRYEAAAEEARRAAEKSMLVRQLKAQIMQLRQECSEKDSELKGLQRKLKANYLSELQAEKEEYYFESMRLRQVISSLRQDMAADIMHRGNPKVENELRAEISRLAVGFQSMLTSSSSSSIPPA
jgi:chromosome segregation ATPase